jgi:phenylalanyl-tRNA synthetase alpha chain
MGFEIIDGHILTDDYSNFTSLNIPENHSARDEQDTFWINDNTLLRTHTSNMQVVEAKKRTPPFGIISSGMVYRNEATDMSHDFMFAQIEGMYFADDASISSLLYVLKRLLNVYFEKDHLEVRARPGIFPFVEPGLEIDFECPFCLKGCSTCKYSKWIEIGGAGMVHSFVKNEIGLSSDECGWAFGIGLTRIVMLKYNITDIRKLHQSIIKV